jgi:Predicted metal-binding, possibly nucleic acid-binding protein
LIWICQRKNARKKKRTLRLWRETSSMWKNWFVMSS